MSLDPRLRLSRQHEADVAEWLGGHRSKSSGSQWNDSADGKHGRYDDFAFGWDCKCVLPGTKSLSISRNDLDKIVEQARGRRPAMPLRFYDSERGAFSHDLILIKIQDFLELRQGALG